jgi:O-succinylbenzoic acid--CoA ligase
MTYEEFIDEWNSPAECVEVQTSGSTGRPKKMLVEKARMRESANMTCDFLGLKAGDTALLCMSLDYIAGKMMAVRSIVRGLHLQVVAPSNRPLKGLDSSFDFAAMVPSQVYESLRHEEEAERLRQTRHLIIGGGAVSKDLEAQLRLFPNAVWSTYGMTETLSHIAMRRLNGSSASDWYTPMSGVGISGSADGCLVIDAPRLCSERLVTNDIAEISNGQFRIIGRRDNVICSGGIKIQIEEVENLLCEHLKEPFAVTRKKYAKFGEAVVLVTEQSDTAAAERICRAYLPPYWRPKHYYHIEKIPMTETHKIARGELERLVEKI